MGRDLMVETIRFSCKECNRKLKAPRTKLGDEIKCPRCKALVFVPARSTREEILVMRDFDDDAKDGTVGLNIALPKQLGAVNTLVSQSTANAAASTMVGGLIMAVGVILATILGLKRA